MASSAGEEPPAAAIFSPRRDLLCFSLLLALALAASPWLRVYFRITVVRTELVEIDREGRRQVLPEPPELDLSRFRSRAPAQVLRIAEATFRRLSARPEWARRVEQGGRLEWTIFYSRDSRALDQRHVLTHPEGSDGPR